MKNEKVHTLVLGAGPAGLAAGYTLAKAGLNPLVIEKDKVVGGLMRSIKRGDFILDVGRKELYNRLEKVDRFWGDLLGADYRTYSHRGGLLFDGKIIDHSPAYQGIRRGMPWPMFFGCSWDFVMAQIRPKRSHPRNLEEYFYQSRGRRLTQVFSQAFQEKLTGHRWSDIPMPENSAGNGDDDSGAVSTFKAALARTFSKKEVNTYNGLWRHPARGTGQICDNLAAGILQHGGRIEYNARLLGISGSANQVDSVSVELGSEQINFQPSNLVSSLPIEILVPMLLGKPSDATQRKPSFRKKAVILVYLFLNEPPRFPHAYLHVTCPRLPFGRVTNYASYNGDMVPPGKTALCVEFYTFGEDDPLLHLTDQQFAEKTIADVGAAGLIDRSKCFDSLVLRFPGADASQNRDNWLSNMRRGLLAELKPFDNLFYVNRTELDIATLAGIESAEAIISGNRADFDCHLDPSQLGIRSDSKAFAFHSPVPIPD
jgi:protoporphyrinogen oxidase